MLSRTFEWYRIVNPRPSSQTIDNRNAAAQDIVKAIDEAEDWHLLLGCAAGVVAGFEKRFAQDSPVVQCLVGAIREHESAFPQDLSENALALRACAAIAIGEILVRSGDEAPGPDALVISSVLRSGLGPRPSPKARHLRQVLEELDAAATKVLSSGGLLRRQLVVQPPEAADPSALNKAIKKIVQQSAIDREELNVLWWMFAGTSTTNGQPIAAMKTGEAVLCCGAELGSQCLLPPTSSLEAMVRRAYEAGRNLQGMKDRDIEALAADWKGESPHVLVPDEDAQNYARKYPSLFPLSWLCDRLLTSKGATGWTTEFERMTHIPANHSRSPANWAIQVFRERVAHRAIMDSVED